MLNLLISNCQTSNICKAPEGHAGLNSKLIETCVLNIHHEIARLIVYLIIHEACILLNGTSMNCAVYCASELDIMSISSIRDSRTAYIWHDFQRRVKCLTFQQTSALSGFSKMQANVILLALHQWYYGITAARKPESSMTKLSLTVHIERESKPHGLYE